MYPDVPSNDVIPDDGVAPFVASGQQPITRHHLQAMAGDGRSIPPRDKATNLKQVSVVLQLSSFVGGEKALASKNPLNPRLLRKQKSACFDEASGGDDAARMNQEPMSRQWTPFVAGETISAGKIPVNPTRHTPQNASSTRTGAHRHRSTRQQLRCHPSLGRAYRSRHHNLMGMTR